MERVAFLIEDSGERIGCLLNPESLELKRLAGIRNRRVQGDLVSGFNQADDQLMLTGGGITTLTLDLLFDVSLAGSSLRTRDVRDLTGRLWALTENAKKERNRYAPPLCRFLWGKSWNIPAVVTAIAERVEYFDANGVPARSWLRMKLRKVSQPVETAQRPGQRPVRGESAVLPTTGSVVEEATHVLLGSSEAGDGERLDQLAETYYGSAALWRIIAVFNGIVDPLHLESGQVLHIPDTAALETTE
ncbi:CIS tube protein [Thiolapillus sp.]